MRSIPLMHIWIRTKYIHIYQYGLLDYSFFPLYCFSYRTLFFSWMNKNMSNGNNHHAIRSFSPNQKMQAAFFSFYLVLVFFKSISILFFFTYVLLFRRSIVYFVFYVFFFSFLSSLALNECIFVYDDVIAILYSIKSEDDVAVAYLIMPLWCILYIYNSC